MEEFTRFIVVLACAVVSLMLIATVQSYANDRLYRSGAYGPLVGEARRYLFRAGLWWTIGVFVLLCYGTLLFTSPSMAWTRGVLYVAVTCFVVVGPALVCRGWYLARLAWK